MKPTLKVFSEYDENERPLIALFSDQNDVIVEEILFSYPYDVDWVYGDDEWISAYDMMNDLATFAEDMAPQKLKLTSIVER